MELVEDLQKAYSILESILCNPIEVWVGRAAFAAIRRTFREVTSTTNRLVGISFQLDDRYGTSTITVAGSAPEGAFEVSLEAAPILNIGDEYEGQGDLGVVRILSIGEEYVSLATEHFPDGIDVPQHQFRANYRRLIRRSAFDILMSDEELV